MGDVSNAILRNQAENVISLPFQAQRTPVLEGAAGALAGVIEAASTNNYSRSLVVHYDSAGRISEQYRDLRAHLLALHCEKPFCLMITSAEPGEGKSVTCVNLALALATRKESLTVVVDCDLRKKAVAGLLNMDGSAGLADVLRGTATAADAIRPTVYPNLFVMPAGRAEQQEVGELLSSPQLQHVTAGLRRKYDYVLLDSPPVNTVSDASMVGVAAGEALLVIRMNKTRRESVRKAVRLLQGVNVKLSGLVLTHQRYFIPSCLYRCS